MLIWNCVQRMLKYIYIQGFNWILLNEIKWTVCDSMWSTGRKGIYNFAFVLILQFPNFTGRWKSEWSDEGKYIKLVARGIPSGVTRNTVTSVENLETHVLLHPRPVYLLCWFILLLSVEKICLFNIRIRFYFVVRFYLLYAFICCNKI